MPAYSGTRYQRGHGIGSFLSGIWRTIWPILRPAATEAGKRALTAGTRIVGDIVQGEKHIGDSLKERAGQFFRGEGKQNKRKRTAKKKPSAKKRRTVNIERSRDFFA